MDWFSTRWRNVEYDIIVRNKVQRGELKKKLMISLQRNKKTLKNLKWSVSIHLNKSNLGFLTKVQNTCLFSTNTRSVYRKYRLNRSTLKTFANKGWLVGLRKSSF